MHCRQAFCPWIAIPSPLTWEEGLLFPAVAHTGLALGILFIQLLKCLGSQACLHHQPQQLSLRCFSVISSSLIVKMGRAGICVCGASRGLCSCLCASIVRVSMCLGLHCCLPHALTSLLTSLLKHKKFPGSERSTWCLCLLSRGGDLVAAPKVTPASSFSIVLTGETFISWIL